MHRAHRCARSSSSTVGNAPSLSVNASSDPRRRPSHRHVRSSPVSPMLSQFRSARQFAAYLGLVPRHSGTGGRVKLLGISKRGDTYLRTLLIHGARSVLLSHRRHRP